MSEAVQVLHWDGSVLLSRADWESLRGRLRGTKLVERTMPARRAVPTDYERANGSQGRLFVPPLVPPALMLVRVMDYGPFTYFPQDVWSDLSRYLTRHGARIIRDLPNYDTTGKPYHVRPGPKPRN